MWCTRIPPGKDELIGCHGDFIGPHLMAVAGGAHQLAGGFLTVVLHHGYTAVNILGDEAAHLLLGHGAVHPVGKQNGDIPVRHAGLIQLPHQDGDINVAAGQAGDVIGEDTYGIPGMDLLGQQPAPMGWASASSTISSSERTPVGCCLGSRMLKLYAVKGG